MNASSTATPSQDRMQEARRVNRENIVNLALRIIEKDIQEFDSGVPSLAIPKDKLESDDSQSSSSSQTPPLDQVTVTTCSFYDDSESGSVSSVSSAGDECFSPSAPRSIFNSYWQKNGGAPSLRVAPVSSVVIPYLVNEESSSSENIYERTLKVKEVSSPSPSSQRRKIFGQGVWSKSENDLNVAPLAATNYVFMRRSIQSSSAILEKPKASCLRAGRFSSSSRQPSTPSVSDNASVSFSDDVSVHVFRQTSENWAHEGWSKWFTC